MRVAVLGGTRFIGRAASEALTQRGHELLIVHRGESEPETLSDVRHVHVSRAKLREAASVIEDFSPDAVLDSYALTAADATTALAVIPVGTDCVVLSSCDVYRAYTSRDEGTVTDPVPLSEDAPLRTQRYPYRGRMPGFDDYDKLDVEDAYRARNATILRLGFVYGPHDGQTREEFVLKRVRASRQQIPSGPGNWLLSRCYVADAADAVVRAVERRDVAGRTLNIAETAAATVRLWAQQILAAAGSSAKLVRVPSRVLPADMAMTAAISQHLAVDTSRARRLLGWEPSNPADSVAQSVAWHLAHPPVEAFEDFSADDVALEAARGS